MEEKKIQELNPDEMNRVSGGSHRDGNGNLVWDGERCPCGGEFLIVFYSGGIYTLKCNTCGSRAIGG